MLAVYLPLTIKAQTCKGLETRISNRTSSTRMSVWNLADFVRRDAAASQDAEADSTQGRRHDLSGG